jgi:hypothetical protein
MIAKDKNQTLEPPEGALLKMVWGDGAYLRLVYHASFWYNPLSHGTRVTTVFLQDTGREVLRTIDEVLDPLPTDTATKTRIARRFKIRNGFLLALQGLKEMFT